MNIVLRSGITTGDDKGKWTEEDGWVRKTTGKEVGFYLDRTKESFMEAYAEASTSGS